MIESCQAVQGIFSPATPTCSQGASWTTDNYMPGPWQEKYEKTFQSISVTHNNAPAGNSRLKLNSNNQRFLRKIIFFFGKKQKFDAPLSDLNSKNVSNRVMVVLLWHWYLS